jgi:hypothetical protein
MISNIPGKDEFYFRRTLLYPDLVRPDAPVGPNFQRQLVVVGDLADPGVLNGVVDLADRGEDRVDGNYPDDVVPFLLRSAET